MTGTEVHHLTELKGCKHLVTGLINNHIENLTRTELARYSGSHQTPNIKDPKESKTEIQKLLHSYAGSGDFKTTLRDTFRLIDALGKNLGKFFETLIQHGMPSNTLAQNGFNIVSKHQEILDEVSAVTDKAELLRTQFIPYLETLGFTNGLELDAKVSIRKNLLNILESMELSRQTIKTKITKLANLLLSHQESRLAKKINKGIDPNWTVNKVGIVDMEKQGSPILFEPRK